MTDPTPRLPPPLAADAHKGSAGRLLCLAGSVGMPGAASLVAEAALRGGAGLVTLGVFHQDLIQAVAPRVPEAVYLDLSRTQDLYAGRLPREIEEHRHHVRLAGPGLSRSGRTRELVRRLVESDFTGPTLLDADGLNVLAGAPEVLQQARGPVVLTPHPGEAERLLGARVPREDVGRVAAARELAESSGALVVLKGARTVVVEGEQVWTCDHGGPALATAGTGDVLSGLLAAYLCAAAVRHPEDPDRGDDAPPAYDPFTAACTAVEVHARAGDRARTELGVRGVLARDVLRHLPAAQLELEDEG